MHVCPDMSKLLFFYPTISGHVAVDGGVIAYSFLSNHVFVSGQWYVVDVFESSIGDALA